MNYFFHSSHLFSPKHFICTLKFFVHNSVVPADGAHTKVEFLNACGRYRGRYRRSTAGPVRVALVYALSCTLPVHHRGPCARAYCQCRSKWDRRSCASCATTVACSCENGQRVVGQQSTRIILKWLHAWRRLNAVRHTGLRNGKQCTGCRLPSPPCNCIPLKDPLHADNSILFKDP